VFVFLLASSIVHSYVQLNPVLSKEITPETQAGISTLTTIQGSLNQAWAMGYLSVKVTHDLTYLPTRAGIFLNGKYSFNSS